MLKNQVLKTPPMGWNSYMPFGNKVSEQIVRETVDTLIAKNLKKAGYTTVVIDDGWTEKHRDASGKLVPDRSRFSGGLKKLSQYIHNQGMQFGLTLTGGYKSCWYECDGSFGLESFDAWDVKQFDVDYIKYDLCGNTPMVDVLVGPYISNFTVGDQLYNIHEAELMHSAKFLPNDFVTGLKKDGGYVNFFVNMDEAGVHPATLRYLDKSGSKYFKVQVNNQTAVTYLTWTKTQSDDNPRDSTINAFMVNLTKGKNVIKIFMDHNKTDNLMEVFKRMEYALHREKLDNVVFEACDWGQYESWLWANGFAHLWRNTFEIERDWLGAISYKNILDRYSHAVTKDEFGQANGFNDAGPLLVGHKGLSHQQSINHFSLHCIMMSPLFIGMDIRSLDKSSIDILLNEQAIAINQDPYAIQGDRFYEDQHKDYIAKPLDNGDVALLILNKNSKNNVQFNINLKKLFPEIKIKNSEVWQNATNYECTEAWSSQKIKTQNAEFIGFVATEAVGLYVCTPMK